MPTAPVIGGVTDHVGPVTGNVAPGGSTDDSKPTISGSGAKPGDIIIIKDGGTGHRLGHRPSRRHLVRYA